MFCVCAARVSLVSVSPCPLHQLNAYNVWCSGCKVITKVPVKCCIETISDDWWTLHPFTLINIFFPIQISLLIIRNWHMKIFEYPTVCTLCFPSSEGLISNLKTLYKVMVANRVVSSKHLPFVECQALGWLRVRIWYLFVYI